MQQRITIQDNNICHKSRIQPTLQHQDQKQQWTACIRTNHQLQRMWTAIVVEPSSINMEQKIKMSRNMSMKSNKQKVVTVKEIPQFGLNKIAWLS